MHSIPVYHVDSENKITEYIQNNKFLDSQEDGDWLGSGMYFWDNVANSKYWQAIKIRHNPAKTYKTVKVQQTFEDNELLDLTDKEIMASTLQYASVLEGRGKSQSRDVTKHMGALLNTLYEVTAESPEIFGFSFSVIKGTGLYSKTVLSDNDNDLINTTLSKTPHLTHFMKTIYLFKHDNHAVIGSKIIEEISI
ncbi:hypothetical protein [Leuconostoc citreum]|uniref:hypothetical protein n=1 Tax=Leuconostoc citreum TaxID=33964 RepID=UPI00186B7DA9|nr:hypothetical protein [Leuconostoc citreum]MBE4726277.1 hypothetical protein [Leuconostoc citreum]